ncbi:flavoprotein [Aquisphaera insulae]|uniref:flavoprotein n=1 Tax=Aquisphaera insulae TaxID=2712864 RepID=UPI0013E9FA4A|nr:flavoprotein [Aquisphaera insulae]
MARVLLGVTGSVAAIRTPALVEALRASHHDVRIIATEPSLYFFDPRDLSRGDDQSPAGGLYRDRDEWPNDRYHRGDAVLHIELRNWAELLVVAPLDANTLGKFALGLSDNFLTCVFRAWDFQRPVILAPAMNTLMWQSPVTARHLGQILLDQGRLRGLPVDWSLESAPEHFARLAPRIILIPPQSKRLACGDIGVGAMAEVEAIAEVVHSWTSSGAEGEHDQQARVTKS